MEHDATDDLETGLDDLDADDAADPDAGADDADPDDLTERDHGLARTRGTRLRAGRRPRILARGGLKTAVKLNRDTTHYPEGVERPITRGDCQGGPRPCPWVSCRYHMYLSVNPETGAITINFPDLEPWELRETCTLDITDQGPRTLEEVGVLMNLTRERVRQLESKGLKLLRHSRDGRSLIGEDDE